MLHRLSPNLRRLLLSLTLMLSLSACATAQQRPQVTLQNLQIQHLNLFSQTFLVRLLVSNPNASPLAFRAGELRLLVDRQQIAQGLLSQPLQIPPYASKEVSVPVHANLFASATHWSQWSAQGSIPYELQGYLLTDTLVPIRVPIRVRGVLHLPSLPATAGAP